ncbi:TIM-barrel domain-containing protein [Sphingopyxis indica]|uniref:Alpha-D-xyloside xylohydrolase n=1 Tax=Sphingopyxis indica TaxID=436663 RepID=A0A239JAW7_9SPHN|nr:TIM-barrel domain-containing protein [Sphingopyxis indica]SNT02965.1 alpha-D-xyloside xylohydrolase [Sphingopyxis indica]
MSIRHSSIRLVLAGLLACSATSALAEGTYRATGTGVIVNPDQGSERTVRLQVYGDGLIRVTAAPTETIDLPSSLMVTAVPQTDGFTLSEGPGSVTLATGSVSAEVQLSDGQVTFRDSGGKILLTEGGPASFTPVTVEGQRRYTVSQQFNRGTDEGLYGLGQHQNGQMNYNGEDVELAQHNMDIAVPFVVSTRNYGLLWDNNSITRFGNPKPYALAGSDGDGLTVTGSDGKPGWTAQYYLGDKLAVTQNEQVINYQYIRDNMRWPEAAKAQTVASTAGQNTAGNAVQTQRVIWTGKVTPGKSGLHRFRLYSSSYVKVFVNGKEVLERWRQNWNPWYHNFDVPMKAGKATDIRIEWEPNAGYIALVHNAPLPDADRHSLSFTSDLGQAVDYYVTVGKDMDGAIAGYRKLTGKSAMLPQWAYGFWQSRQRYDTQEELLGVVREYRRRNLPLDNIVLDWRYWEDDSWGCHCFDAKRFPDPKGMVDEVHALNARIMISVWPKFYPATDNYKELDKVGGIYRRMVEPRPGEPTDPQYISKMYRDWVGPGYANAFYDPYNPKAQDIYWRQIRENLGDLGIDAWWLDADEPDFHSNLSVEERAYRMGPTARGPGAAFFNSYPLVHSEGVYQRQLATKPNVRPFILSRSGFGGTQRAGTALWSGDVVSRWDDLKDQISAGVNLSMSGIPNWTHDIGGFALEDRYTKQDPAHIDEWRELNLRWFQFGAFSPLFRSHGETPKREIYEIAPEGSPMYASMEWYLKLRYRLMPYIYTLAGDTWQKDSTIMRGLVMDFPADPRVRNINDQYMFGSAFLVAPVTEFKARSRKVYLPAGAGWYDFNNGAYYKGGQEIVAEAPYERMPLFVRSGSIVPTGPEIEHTREEPDGPIVLHIFTGADGSFSLYEDDGTSEGYKRGEFVRIPVQWNDARGELTIGKREGGYGGMPFKRAISVRFYDKDSARAIDFAENGETSIVYDGTAVTVRKP